MTTINIGANRRTQNYSNSEQLFRFAWQIASILIAWSPRPAFAWRRLVLRTFGAKVGKEVNIYSSTRIYLPWNLSIGDWSALGEDVFVYSLGKVNIGNNVTISYRSHLCAGTHNLHDPLLPLLKPPIVIDDGVWIGTDAFIGPGVTVGTLAVVGARAVVIKNVAPNTIVGGNAARVIGQRSIESVTAPLQPNQ